MLVGGGRFSCTICRGDIKIKVGEYVTIGAGWRQVETGGAGWRQVETGGAGWRRVELGGDGRAGWRRWSWVEKVELGGDRWRQSM